MTAHRPQGLFRIGQRNRAVAVRYAVAQHYRQNTLFAKPLGRAEPLRNRSMCNRIRRPGKSRQPCRWFYPDRVSAGSSRHRRLRSECLRSGSRPRGTFHCSPPVYFRRKEVSAVARFRAGKRGMQAAIPPPIVRTAVLSVCRSCPEDNDNLSYFGVRSLLPDGILVQKSNL